MIVEQQPCKVPDDPILNFIDFMGRYTILLNGTVLQKEATKGELQDLADEHKKEVIDKFKRLWESRPIANNGVSLDYIKKVVDDSTSNILDDFCLDKISSVIHTKLQPTAPLLSVVKKAVESGAVVIKPCTANCLNGIITDHEGAEVRDIVCPTCSGREYVITEGEVSGG